MKRTSMILFLALGCATAAPVNPAGHVVTVNGAPLAVSTSQTVLDVTRSRLSIFRLGLATARLYDAPRYYVDNVEIVNGPAWMARARATDIDSVRTLAPVDAVTRLGGGVRGGAILIFTRGSRD